MCLSGENLAPLWKVGVYNEHASPLMKGLVMVRSNPFSRVHTSSTASQPLHKRAFFRLLISCQSGCKFRSYQRQSSCWYRVEFRNTLKTAEGVKAMAGSGRYALWLLFKGFRGCFAQAFTSRYVSN